MNFVRADRAVEIMSAHEVLLNEDSIDKLIDEIEKRPPLYLKSLKEYADANLKKKLWEEVCVTMVDNWHDLSPEEKKTHGKHHFNILLLM